MTTYRVYFLTEDDRIQAPSDAFDTTNDAAALVIFDELCAINRHWPTIELWREERCLARRSRRTAAHRGDKGAAEPV